MYFHLLLPLIWYLGFVIPKYIFFLYFCSSPSRHRDRERKRKCNTLEKDGRKINKTKNLQLTPSPKGSTDKKEVVVSMVH